MKTEFRKKLEQLINSESMENGSDTPDFILAEFLCDVLDTFDRRQRAREKWYGRQPEKLPSYEAPKPAPDANCHCLQCEAMRGNSDSDCAIEKHFRDEPGARPG